MTTSFTLLTKSQGVTFCYFQPKIFRRNFKPSLIFLPIDPVFVIKLTEFSRVDTEGWSCLLSLHAAVFLGMYLCDWEREREGIKDVCFLCFEPGAEKNKSFESRWPECRSCRLGLDDGSSFRSIWYDAIAQQLRTWLYAPAVANENQLLYQHTTHQHRRWRHREKT